MWTTTIHYNMHQRPISDAQPIFDKVEELKALDGHGLAMPGYTIEEQTSGSDWSAITIKRKWNNQHHAQALVDFVNTFEFAQASFEQDPE